MPDHHRWDRNVNGALNISRVRMRWIGFTSSMSR
jgi:hypothetical protein